MYEVLKRLAHNNQQYRALRGNREIFEHEQVALLKEIPVNDPMWFELHVGVPGMWKFPHRFVVDEDLYGRSTTIDPKIPLLFRRIIEEFTSGALGMDHFGLALQKLSRRSTREQFEWYRRVLEQRVLFPTSPRLANQLGYEYRLYEPTFPKISYPARITIPIQAVIIEEANSGTRVFVDTQKRMAFDEFLEPDLEFSKRFENAVKGSQFTDQSIRVEFYDVQDEWILRDFENLDPSQDKPEYQLPARINTVMELWDSITMPRSNAELDCNIVERVHADPDMLKIEIDLIRQKGFSGFNLIQGNGDALSVRFDQNPLIEIDSTQIRIHVSQS